ncbi:MAG: hypothetical protein ACKO1N_09515 [Erythrobacter sp.]
MSNLRTVAYRLSLCVMVVSAVLIVAWLVLLMDYSYAVIAAPVSFVGIVSWSIAGLIRWQHWFMVPLATYGLPFLPWAEWMHG